MKKLGIVLMIAALILFFYFVATSLENPQGKNGYAVLGFLSAALGLVGVILSVTGEE
jgi:uncharacterized membrane protein YbaN (DUF454 family)